jgi:hypothetical protein
VLLEILLRPSGRTETKTLSPEMAIGLSSPAPTTTVPLGQFGFLTQFLDVSSNVNDLAVLSAAPMKRPDASPAIVSVAAC